jgi:MYXO-CTERM domain-containing protein
MARLSAALLAGAFALQAESPRPSKLDAALQALAAGRETRALVVLSPGALPPPAPGVSYGGRAGDVVTARGRADALAALALHPSVLRLEGARRVVPLDLLSGASSIGVSGTISAPAEVDTYTFSGTVGQTCRIRVHAESTLDAALTVTDAAPALDLDSGPGTDPELEITWASTGPKTIAVTEQGGTTTGPYALFVTSSTPISTADLAGGDPGAVVFFAGTRAREARAALGVDGAGITIGVVDNGIDFTHGDFRDAAGRTRIAALWDQTLTAVAGETAPSAGYGVEYTEGQINGHLDGTTPGFVRQVDATGHGTHVAGTAAGDGPLFPGGAPGARLVVVKHDGTTAGVIDGIGYAFSRAGTEGVVVNLSQGSHFGPHDGTSAFDLAVDQSSSRGRYVVVAAGNEATTAIHARSSAASGPAVWTFTPTAALTSVTVDAWADGADRYSVTATDGVTTVTAADATLASGPAFLPYLTVANRTDAPANGATHILVTSTAAAPLTITFTRTTAGGSGIVDGYSNDGTFGAAEAVFTGTISEPGTARKAVTVGAYRTRFAWDHPAGTERKPAGAGVTGNRAAYSSLGPTRDGRAKPDLYAPGAWLGAARVAGSATSNDHDADGIHTFREGTSMATAAVSGGIALLLQRNRILDPDELKGFLASTSLSDGLLSGKFDAFALAGALPLQFDIAADPSLCQGSAGAPGPGPGGLALLAAAILFALRRRP